MKKNCRDRKSYITTQGSALLLVILVMSVLSLLCITFWQSSITVYDISLVKLAYEKKYRAAACGLDYAIDFCTKHFDALCKYKKQNPYSNTLTLSFEIGQTEGIEKSVCSVAIVPKGSSPKDAKIHITSQLLTPQHNSSHKKLFQLSCDIVQVTEHAHTMFAIQNWQSGL